jgi:hypothetical protein
LQFQVPSHELIYQVTRLPTYGKLVHEDGNRAVTNFTQADIDNQKISYSATHMELNAWSVRDHFNFVIANAKNLAPPIQSVNTDNDFPFRILLSYAFIDASRLDTVLARKMLLVSRGGSVMMNSTFLNLTKLASLCDDALFVEIERRPKHGTLEFLGPQSEVEEEDDKEEIPTGSTLRTIRKRSITADDLHSGRHLLYNNFNGPDENDEFILGVYALRGERNKRPARLKIPIQVFIQHTSVEAKV